MGEASNYKGVMLCNRPTDAAPSKPTAMDAPRFRPVGVRPEQIGLNPSKENLVCNAVAMREEASRRRADFEPEPETFLTKHRRWLADMAKKKAMLNHELQA